VKPTTRRRFLQGAGAATVSAYLAACGSSSTETASSSIGRLRVIVPYTPDLLATGHVAQEAGGPLMLALEPLLRVSLDYQPEPNLAAVHTDGPLRYVCRLRPGVRFWDGSPLTVADVIYSFYVHAKPGSQSAIADLWSGVRSMRHTGADELTITLGAPNPGFIFTLAQTGISSVAFHDRHGTETGTPGVLVMGTGPYRPVAFTPSSQITFNRNPRYWGPRPRIGTLECVSIEDQATALQAMQTRSADMILNIPISQVLPYKRAGGIALTSAIDASVYKFNFDQRKPPWGDLHLRAAFAHGVHRAALTEILGGNATAATTLVPPRFFASLLSPSQLQQTYARLAALMPAYDIQAGRRALAQSSVPGGVSATVLISPADPTLSTLVQAVSPDLARIGIKLGLREVDDVTYERDVYFEHATGGLSLDDFGAECPDPGNIPNDVLSSANALPRGNGVNIADYDNAAVDALLARQRVAPQSQRAALIVQALEQAARDLPYVPLIYPKVLLGLTSGYRYNGFNTFWWMNRWTELVDPRA
jgi:peptide/nickel transport system substrate-binding protein